jgi:hypothetical protein
VELFDGPVDDGILLFSDPFQETARLTKSFVLVGDGTLAPLSRSSSRTRFHDHTLSLSLITLVLFLGLV